MKKLLCILFALGLVSCEQESYEAWIVEITNPAQIERSDEPVVLTREQLKPGGDKRVPAVQDARGNYIASQADDLNGDGKWDELAFVADLAAAGSSEFKIVWIERENYPEFRMRTNVRYGKMTAPGHVEELYEDTHYKDETFQLNTKGYPYQMDGIGWENDCVGFRHYYDGRNNRDYFGKRVTGMVLDTVGIRADGYPGDTYHVWADWGRDIMSVGSSFGIGGLAAWVDDSRLVKLGRSDLQVPDIIDSTHYKLLYEGPVRSAFALDFYGWEVEGNKIDLHQEVTIWAGKHNYDNKVIAPDLPENVSLVTGFLYNFNDMPLEELDFSGYAGMATHDHQTYNKEFIMGVGLILPKSNLDRMFLSVDYIPEEALSRTWMAKLKLDDQGAVNYKAYAVWEHQDVRFQERDYFLNLMRSEGERLDQPVRVSLKK